MSVKLKENIMKEKSLKQREQLEGYRRDVYNKKLLKKDDDFGFLNDEEQEKKKLIMKGYISSYE